MTRSEFIKDIDYYLEEGRVVFTSKYLALIGICCGTGCRHCPYIPCHIKDNRNLEDDNNNLKKSWKIKNKIVYLVKQLLLWQKVNKNNLQLK